MWLLFVRDAEPDAKYWPGRRVLAVIDAVAWPALVAFAFHRLPSSGGLLGGVAMSLAVLVSLGRVRTAALANQRYRFMTWRLARVLLPLLALGLLLRLLLAQ